MLIRCWGARGSIPVSGAAYLRYGGDTPCIEIRTAGDDVIVIDAGSGVRRLGNLLEKEKRHEFSMVFTHAHWDHIMGFPFFKPIYRRGTRIRFYGCPSTQESVQGIIASIMSPPNFPVPFADITARIAYQEACRMTFAIGGMSVSSIPLSHPNEGRGYRFEEDGKSFVFLTDNELTYRHPGGMAYEDYRDFCRGADLLVHDAEYIPRDYRQTRTWGHSVYTDTLRLALDAGVARLGLYHHNQDRTDAGIERMLTDCRRRADGHPLTCFAMSQDTQIVL
jgi:phosphoribosyl 1,2-cyclic phosphodiesterase